MKFVIFHLETNNVGCSEVLCYMLNDACFNEDGSINDDYLCEYGNELARDNAEMYGLLDNISDDLQEDCYYETHEIVELESLEEAEEEYGEVCNL